MADRPSMKDGLSELFRRTDSSGAPPEQQDLDEPVKGRPYVTTIKVVASAAPARTPSTGWSIPASKVSSSSP